MRSVNKVIIIGNLTRAPEMRETPNNQKVTTFGIATNRVWMSQGEKKSSAEFHECVAWSRLAEICNQHLSKGQLVYIEGYLKTRSWDNTEGVKKFKTEIVVTDMIRLEKRPYEDSDNSETQENISTHEQSNNTEHSDKTSEEAIKEKPEQENATKDVEQTSTTESSTSEDLIDKDLGL